MTYYSDFESVDYLDDYSARQTILRDFETISLMDSTETVPEDLLEAFEDVY